MVHNMTKRNAIVYRYYTCVRAIKRGRQSCKHPSLPAGEIEAAVVDQVRMISRDTGLRDEIIRQAMEATQQGKKELEAQQTQLTRQLNRDHGEVQQLGRSIVTSFTERMISLLTSNGVAERSKQKVP